MIIRTRVPQFGHRTRKQASGNLQQRVTQQLEQSRRDKQSSCDHWFVRKGTSKAAPRVCTKCGAERNY
jgi:hypothetical protein